MNSSDRGHCATSSVMFHQICHSPTTPVRSIESFNVYSMSIQCHRYSIATLLSSFSLLLSCSSMGSSAATAVLPVVHASLNYPSLIDLLVPINLTPVRQTIRSNPEGPRLPSWSRSRWLSVRMYSSSSCSSHPKPRPTSLVGSALLLTHLLGWFVCVSYLFLLCLSRKCNLHLVSRFH